MWKLSFVDSTLFQYNFSFTEGNEVHVVSEISACRAEFVQGDEWKLYLVGDAGEYFTATLRQNQLGEMKVEFHTQVPLVIDGSTIDSEGVELDSESNSVLISSERPLGLFWRNATTGEALPGSTNYTIPEDIASRFQPNLGLESVTALGDFVVTAFEGALSDEEPGTHRFLAYDADGGDPVAQWVHNTSIWEEAGDKPLSLNDLAAVDDQRVLLLERGYNGQTNMIRVWITDIQLNPSSNSSSAGSSSYSQSLLNWTDESLQLTHSTIDIPVDNYEALCLLPESNFLLLVNDENYNPFQIGTQFVLLKMEKDHGFFDFPTPSANEEVIIAGAIAAMVILCLCLIACICKRRKWKKSEVQEAHEPADGEMT